MHLVNRNNEITISLDEIQGLWTEEIYVTLTDHSNLLIEFTDGYMDFLPMPTDKHHAILRFLFRIFDALMMQTGGTVFFAALRLQIRLRVYREPDLMLLLAKDDPRRQNRYCGSARIWWSTG